MSEQAIKEILKRQLVNLVPIPKGSGKALKQSWKNYQTERYLDPVPDDQDFAVICGTVSDNLVVFDFDHCDNLDLLNEIIPDALNQTLVVKSGNGFHLYTKFNGQIPPTKQWLKKNGQTIEVQTHGFYVIGPTCDYYTKDNSGKYVKTDKKYQVISYTTTIREVNPLEISQRIRDNGWSTDKTIIDNGGREYIPTDELTNGGWQKGERNPKGVMLGVRRFHAGYNFDQVLAEALEINKTCNPIADYPYVEAWVTQAAELHKKNLRNGFYSEETNIQKQDEPQLKDLDGNTVFRNEDFDLVAQVIKNENHFVTIRENKEIWYYDNLEGYYKPFGHTIIEESCQKLVQRCKKNTVTEVIETIRRDKTMINMKDLFDSAIINTQNGILDPNTFELKPHNPKYLTISKLPFTINPNARNLKLWNHILTIIDKKDINLIMELIWICVSWNNPFKKMFVFKGESNTQKTTLADIITWIIGEDNVSKQKPNTYLSKGARFGTAKFIGKRMNVAGEIDNLSSDELENQKALVGGEKQNTERKGDNTDRVFDPNKFVFLYTTNKLGAIYSQINDNSVITRFQFLIFRNKIEDKKTNGQWYQDFFIDELDKQTAISTIINIVINYKKAQVFKKIPKTQWSGIEETKRILKEQMPLEDKYFEIKRLIHKEGEKLTLDEIRSNFEQYVGYSVKPLDMGHILKRNGFTSGTSNGVTYYKNTAFDTAKDQMRLAS